MTTNTNIQTLLEALNVSELPVEEQEELILSLNDMVFEGTLVRLIERMDEPTREEFSALLEKDTPEEEVEAFIAERVPDADKAVEETVADLTNDILSATKQ